MNYKERCDQLLSDLEPEEDEGKIRRSMARAEFLFEVLRNPDDVCLTERSEVWCEWQIDGYAKVMLAVGPNGTIRGFILRRERNHEKT